MVAEDMREPGPRYTIDTEEFGEMLRVFRNQRGMTQRQLADLSTVSIRAIRDLETGHALRPRRDTVKLLAGGLGLRGRQRVNFEAAAGRALSTVDLTEMFAATSIPPPRALDTLLGRESEVAAIYDLLARQGHRLLTITGVAGVGKSRTALEVARALHEAEGVPVLWRSTDETTARYVMDTWPDRLSSWLRSELGDLASATATAPGVGELGTVIGDRPTVLVLDGYETSTARVSLLAAFLQRCPALRIIVTARAPLGVLGERVVPLPPLAVPAHQQAGTRTAMAEAPSMQLLLRYVRRDIPQFEITTASLNAMRTIVDHVDGLPAALEAVASWFLIDTPQAIVLRLRSAPFDLVREATADLREPLLHSLATLTEAESSTLARLSAEETYWSVDEAAALVGDSVLSCARTVQRLLTLGLVRPAASAGRPRYSVLALVRALHRSADMKRGNPRGRDDVRPGTGGGFGLEC